MKKLQCLLLAIAMLFTAMTVCPVAVADRTVYGDSNNDGVVDAKDALFILRVAVNKQTADDTLRASLNVDGNAALDASDALLVLRFAVNKLERFPVDAGTKLVEDDSKWLEMSMEEIIDTIDGETPATPITDGYKTHADGGMIYNPLSRQMDEAEKTKYNVAKKTTGTLTMGDGLVLSYSLPTDVTAYDMIPIEYTLKNVSGYDPLYVEATTFEDVDGSFYDLCLPGNINLEYTYDGYIAAKANAENRPFLSRNLLADEQGTQYPQYELEKLVSSDNVKKSDYIWFQFTVKNVGNTILDGDGNGTFCLTPTLVNRQTGNEIGIGNQLYRITEDLYPGQSTKIYLFFSAGGREGNNLANGDYTVNIKTTIRNEESTDAWGTKIWHGYKYGVATKDITISDEGGAHSGDKAVYTQLRDTTRNTWLHTYEEFTTSFDSWLDPTMIEEGKKNTLYVQSASWSDRVVLKLMRGNDNNMVSATIPLKVETDSIDIKLNETADNYIVTDQGTKYPAMASQSMCDMRVNIGVSPYADQKQLDELLDMKECGVNLVTTTEAFNIATSNNKASKPNDTQDSIWFVSDVLKKLGMRMEGYASYPFSDNSGTTAVSAAYWVTRDTRYHSSNLPKNASHGNPLWAEIEGLRALYQFARWGNNYHVNAAGLPVINTEDTRGWMRIDYRARKPIGDESRTAFQEWLKEKYGTIEALNEAWSDEFTSFDYTSFDQINPELDVTEDHDWFNYDNAMLLEWTAGINDFDIFRTLERTENYQDTLDTLKNYAIDNPNSPFPSVNAVMGIRTEGGNMTGVVPSDTPNSHLRHTYYSQRRCALIPQILAKSGTVSMHSDYVTLPYTPDEFTTLVSSSAALGITSMPLLQASRMRDIAINTQQASAYYDLEYNMTGQNRMGVYINTQVSVFEAFKAVYEAGGIPGVLWEDYLCDGYVTETQQKEMKFYSSKIAEMMETDEAKAWATENVQDVQAVHSLSTGGYSYTEEFLDAAIAEAMKNR